MSLFSDLLLPPPQTGLLPWQTPLPQAGLCPTPSGSVRGEGGEEQSPLSRVGCLPTRPLEGWTVNRAATGRSEVVAAPAAGEVRKGAVARGRRAQAAPVG